MKLGVLSRCGTDAGCHIWRSAPFCRRFPQQRGFAHVLRRLPPPHRTGRFHLSRGKSAGCTIFRMRSRSTIIPEATHHCPGLEEIHPYPPVLADVLGMSFRLERSLRSRDIFAESNLFLLFFVHLQLEASSQSSTIFSPDFIVPPSSLLCRSGCGRNGVEASRYLSEICWSRLASHLPFCHGPFQHKLHPGPFRLAFPEVVYLSFSKFNWIN